MTNSLALGISYLYVFLLLIVSEGLKRLLTLKEEFTRKFVHIGVGSWILPTVILFDDWRWAVVPPLSFVIINIISFKFDLIKSMEQEDKGNLGTIYFPLAFCLLLPLLWSQKGGKLSTSVGIMVMAWGDSFASILGKRWGQHRFSIKGNTKSLEGSIAMFIFSFLAALFCLLFFGSLESAHAIWLSAVVAGFATVVEAFSLWGTDNLFVPVLSALLCYALL